MLCGLIYMMIGFRWRVGKVLDVGSGDVGLGTVCKQKKLLTQYTCNNNPSVSATLSHSCIHRLSASAMHNNTSQTPKMHNG